MSANGYVLADLIFNLLALGIRWQELKVKIDEQKAAGADDRQLADFLRGLEQAEIERGDALQNQP